MYEDFWGCLGRGIMREYELRVFFAIEFAFCNFHFPRLILASNSSKIRDGYTYSISAEHLRARIETCEDLSRQLIS
jgi:hypothetical protein